MSSILALCELSSFFVQNSEGLTGQRTTPTPHLSAISVERGLHMIHMILDAEKYLLFEAQRCCWKMFLLTKMSGCDTCREDKLFWCWTSDPKTSVTTPIVIRSTDWAMKKVLVKDCPELKPSVDNKGPNMLDNPHPPYHPYPECNATGGLRKFPWCFLADP